MAIVQGVVERKLSALIGAKVTFEKFTVSPLKGLIEAAGVRVGDDQQNPLLTIVLIRAEISIGWALKGEIVTKSVTIEKPVLSVIRFADGTSNLPRRAQSDEPVADGTKWKFDVIKLLLIDGQISLRVGTWELASGRVLAELNRLGDDYSVTFLAEDLRRRDEPAEIGTIGATGTITNAFDLTMIPEAGCEAELTIGDIGRVRFKSPRIRSLQGQIELEGKLTLAQIASLLPPR